MACYNGKMAETTQIQDPRLRAEFEFYLAQPEAWRNRNSGKFVLIREKVIHGVFDTYKDALQEGVKLFGNEQFLIHQVGSEGIVHYNTFSLLGAIAGSA